MELGVDPRVARAGGQGAFQKPRRSGRRRRPPPRPSPNPRPALDRAGKNAIIIEAETADYLRRGDERHRVRRRAPVAGPARETGSHPMSTMFIFTRPTAAR